MNSSHEIVNKKITYKEELGIVYTRVSSKRQEHEGHGLESQEMNCVKYLEKKGIKYHKTFKDSFTGGGDFMKRPSMRELIQYIDKNPHLKFVVVFDDIKRLARDTQAHIMLRTAFRSRKVDVLCPNYSFEDSPEGVFTETIFAAQSELERTQNKRQVIQKQKARLLCGYRPFSAPKGYIKLNDAVHGRIDTPNDKACFVKEALEGFATMRFVHKVDAVIFLQEKGVISKKQNKEKAISTFDKMLREIFYAGYVEYKPWEVYKIPAKHQAIISIEMFDINQRRLNMKSSTIVRQDVRENYPLRGFVNCASCSQKFTGATSTGRGGVKHDYYKCPNKACETYGKSIKALDLHDGFINLLKTIKPSDEVISLTMEIFNDVWNDEKNNQEKLKKQDTRNKTELEDQIREVVKRITASIENPILLSAYERQLEDLSVQISKIEENQSIGSDLDIPYRTAIDLVMQTLKNPYLTWENYNVYKRQRFFSFIFESNLSYDKKDGYRTANYSLPIRLFEQFATSNTLDVEMEGVEPSSI